MFKTAVTDGFLRVALVGVILMGVGVSAINPFQSIIGIERIGYSNAAYAAIVSCGAAFSVIASVLVGIYTDQTGKFREVLLGSLCIGVLAGALMFFAPSKVSFFIVHVVLFPIGATAFTQYFAVASVAARENPDLDAQYSSTVVRATFSGAYALTPPIWGYALATGLDVTAAYALVAIVNVLAFGAVVSLWKSDRQITQTQKSGIGLIASLRELTELSLVVRLVLICVISAINGLYNILLGLLILNNLGGAEQDVAVFAGAVALIEIPVMMLTVRFLKYMSTSALIFAGVVIYGLFLAVLGLMPSMLAAWALVLPAGIGAGILLSVPIGYVQSLVANRAGAGSSLLSLTHFGGMVFASAVFALGTSFTGYLGVAYLGAALGIASGVFLLLLDTWRPRSERTQQH